MVEQEFHIGALAVPVVAAPGQVDDWGKKKRLYAARIVGPSAKWGLERDFGSAAGIITGDVALLNPGVHQGVYEVADYPNGDKRRRYYVLHPKNVVEVLWDATTTEVLRAAEAYHDGVEPLIDITNAANSVVGADLAAKDQVLVKLDEVQAAFESGEYDQEDALMYLDQIREIVERIR